MKKNMKIITLIFLLLFLNSCETARDALQGNKRSDQGDEFLVGKKNPLTMPPDFEKLPIPGELDIVSDEEEEESEIKNLLTNNNDANNDDTTSNQSNDIESSIIDKIQ
tara:strand:+ start:279 stop:602 length:324 start_codon:yes stop_codon:yes gene_type:complete